MEELKKNQKHIAEITGYSSDGSGVCRIGGRAVFVRGAMKGEVWEIKLIRVTSSAVYALAEKCLSPSPSRVKPACPVYGKCGGCGLMHMSYYEELRFKLSRVNDALHHIGGLDFKINEIIGADTVTSYRNKAIYAVGEGENRPITGFYRTRSHDIISVERCLIQPELADRAAAALRAWMSQSGVKAYDEQTGKGSVRHLFVRTAPGAGQAMACVVSARGFGADTKSLIESIRAACPELTSIVLNINKSAGNTVLAGDFHILWGTETIQENLCGLSFELSPQSFFQVNPYQAEKLYNLAISYASPQGSGTVLDLYCGTGTISLCLAKTAKIVIGAEIVGSAVDDARRNAERNGINNAEFICADAGEAAREMAQRGTKPDAVVVDPPRKGLTGDVIDTIAAMSPERVVYVSCDPGSLARDLKCFSELGYSLKAGTAVDMFPRTAHVETVVLMSRVKE